MLDGQSFDYSHIVFHSLLCVRQHDNKWQNLIHSLRRFIQRPFKVTIQKRKEELAHSSLQIEMFCNICRVLFVSSALMPKDHVHTCTFWVERGQTLLIKIIKNTPFLFFLYCQSWVGRPSEWVSSMGINFLIVDVRFQVKEDRLC